MYNVLDFGAKADGATLNSKAFQKAIDECAVHGGGTVFVSPGRYLLGSVVLCSNLTLHLENGAVLLGSTGLDRDFAPDEKLDYPLYQDVSHSFFHHSLFRGEFLENVVIEGAGTIDMQSVWEKDASRWWMQRGAKPLALRECKNVSVRGISVLNATDLALYFAGCETVRVSDVYIDTHIDGISPDCCKDVVITNCVVICGDDAIVPKSSYTLNRFKFCENVTISNCVVSSRCNAIKLGTESNAGYRNFSISNCTIYDTTYAGIALEVVDGGVMEGITISNISMRNVGTPIFIILSDRRRGPEGSGIGRIENVLIDNVVAIGPYETWHPKRKNIEDPSTVQNPQCVASSITGLPGFNVKNVTLSNIRLLVQGGRSFEHADVEKEVPELPKDYPETTRFGLNLPAYGFYCRHCENLTFRNVDLSFIENDDRPALFFEDVKAVRIDGGTFAVGRAGSASVRLKDSDYLVGNSFTVAVK